MAWYFKLDLKVNSKTWCFRQTHFEIGFFMSEIYQVVPSVRFLPHPVFFRVAILSFSPIQILFMPCSQQPRHARSSTSQDETIKLRTVMRGPSTPVYIIHTGSTNFPSHFSRNSFRRPPSHPEGWVELNNHKNGINMTSRGTRCFWPVAKAVGKKTVPGQ